MSCYANAFNAWVQVVDNKCGHISIMLFGQSVQSRFGCVTGLNFSLLMVTHVLGVTEFE